MTRNVNEIDAITRLIALYYDGMIRGDEEKLRRAFHLDCFIIGHLRNDLRWESLDKFVSAVKDSSFDGEESDEDYHNVINTIDVTGDAGIAKITNKYSGMWFTDYLSVLKHDDRWVIINKLYHHYVDHSSPTS